MRSAAPGFPGLERDLMRIAVPREIAPRETRWRLIRALELLRTKVQQNPPRKHGLIPT